MRRLLALIAVLRGRARRLAAAPRVAAPAKPTHSWSARPRTRRRTAGAIGADAKMSLAAPRRVQHDPHHLDLAPRRDDDRRRTSWHALQNSRRRRRPARDPADRLRLPVRLEDRPAVRDHAGPVRLLRRVDPAARPVDPVRDRRQRAEPEPVLDAAVHAGRARRRRLVVPRPARPDLRRDQGGRAAHDRDRRLAGATRRRRPERCSARRTRRRSSSSISGAAYRRSHRTRPVMDWFSIHPYLERSSMPPTFAHPRTTTIAIADYDKLVGLLGQAFDGTAQRGSTLPILYDEFGVQTSAPDGQAPAVREPEPPVGRRRRRRGDAGPRTTAQALQLAACQPNVVGLALLPRRPTRPTSTGGSRASTTPTTRRSPTCRR